MKPELINLITAIVSNIVERGSYVTKTKLLKLLYLFDIEYYRLYKTTFTGFAWKYYHLGPWTAEYDKVLEILVAQNLLKRDFSNRSEYDTEFYKPVEHTDIDRLFSSYKEELALKNVLYKWGEQPTAEILDYVYFKTEPMKYGERNQPLDFSTVSENPPTEYKRSSSGKTKEQIKTLRERFEQRKVASESNDAKDEVNFIPPKYDDEFFESMEKLEELNL